MASSSKTDDDVNEMRMIFDNKVQAIVSDDVLKCNTITTNQYHSVLAEVKDAIHARNEKLPLTTKQYRRLKRYDVLKTNGVEKLIAKRRNKKDPIKYFLHTDEMFDILHATHLATGHKRLRGMEDELKKKYANVTRVVINEYLKLCKHCQMKKKARGKNLNVVEKPLDSNMNIRCQINLINRESEPDGEYKFILNYQDYLTKFTILRPLKTKTSEEVALNMVDVFCLIGAPYILQCNKGQEFSKKVIKCAQKMWPELKIVPGNHRYHDSSDENVCDLLNSWMQAENTKRWSEGLRFVQFKINGTIHSELNRSPYEALFSTQQRLGLRDSDLPHDILDYVETEEALEAAVWRL